MAHPLASTRGQSQSSPKPGRGQPIDRDPSVECDICAESWDWQDYWRGRYLISGNPTTSKTICDECLERADEQHERMTKNRDLWEFTDTDPQEDSDA